MQPNPNAAMAGNLLFGVIVVAIFYFMLFRPQQKQQKAHREMLSNLNKNDEVVTLGGIHGTIISVKEKTFVLRIDDNVKIEIEKSAISYVVKARQKE